MSLGKAWVSSGQNQLSLKENQLVLITMPKICYKFVLTSCQVLPILTYMSHSEHEQQNDKASENLANNSYSVTPFVNRVQIARRYGVCERTIQNMMRMRAIPYHKLGRCVRFKVSDCDTATPTSIRQ
jgi:hypothetical protein